MLTQNDQAPTDISVVNQDDQRVSLADLQGKHVLLYFYPKDNTPGCTKEACSFRDNFSELQNIGVTVIGVSADSPKSHQSFKQKHSLPFPLWSDPDKKLIEAFGVLKEKSMFGKTFLGIQRSSFAIDPNGKILKVWPNVSPQKHTQEVIDFFEKELK